MIYQEALNNLNQLISLLERNNIKCPDYVKNFKVKVELCIKTAQIITLDEIDEFNDKCGGDFGGLYYDAVYQLPKEELSAFENITKSLDESMGRN